MSNLEDIEKLAQLIYQTRKCPQILVKRVQQLQIFGKIEDCLQLMQQFSDRRKQFTLDLLVQITRGWQGFMKKEDGKNKYLVERQIIGDCNLAYQKIFCESCQSELLISEFTNQKIIKQIHHSLKLNIKIVNQVIYHQLEQKDIDQYFNEIKFFEFQGSVDTVLYGISSQDGKRVYISKQIESFKNGIKYIEALIVDHLHQWVIKNKDLLIIIFDLCPEFTTQYQEVGPGSSYLSYVYDIAEWYFSPFEVYMHKPYKYFSVLF